MAEEERASAPQTSAPKPAASSGGGKSNTTLIVIIVVVLAVLIGGGLIARWAIGKVAKKAGEVTTEKILEGATGGDVNIKDNGVEVKSSAGTASFSESKTWPTDMPSVVPEFKSGTIATVSNLNIGGNKSWTVTYEGAKSSDYTSYVNDFKSNGWTEGLSSSSNGETLTMLTKDKYSISLTLNESSGEASLVVSENNETSS
jgi:hypothetical protein